MQPASPLNPNQQRRVGTHLRLLAEDLATLAANPDVVNHGEMGPLLDAIGAEVAAMRAHLALPPEWRPSLRRKVGAVAEVWAARVEDLRAKRLQGYGVVDPAVAPTLDPHVDRLRALLERLALAAATLPENSQ